eukprot:TRINITY_DN155_c5_g1_i1.p1 TRINITY_DN155_c5_g1~~TRINITY_DN155_c5_g1_i1.p1  ORF type:complete len:197 (-),score=45.86 TRINITY_DN155_c5_g1_i1:102-692(-)
MGWGGYGKGGGGWANPWMMMAMMKGKGKGKKGKSGLRSFSNETKVWIGGLPTEANDKEMNMKLKAHMESAGPEVRCLFAEINKNGTGGAVFKTTEEKDLAISKLNGSTFEGAVIQVDVWTRKADGDVPSVSADPSSWAQLVGVDGEQAKTAIQNACPTFKVQTLPEGSMMTMDFCTDRVRIMVDANGKVSTPPRTG